MPAFDIAAAQRPAQPVTSYFQGKAVRLAQESQRIANEMSQQELEDMPRRRQQEDEQHQAELSEHQTKQLRTFIETGEQFLRTGDYDNANALSQRMGLGELPREGFDMLAASLPDAQEGAEYGTTPREGMRNGKPAKFLVGKDGSIKWLDDVGVMPDDGGKPKFGSPQKGVNPASGQEEFFVVDDQGQPKFLGIAPTPGSDNVRSQKIAGLVSRGVSPERAAALADGFERMEVVPQTGMVRLIDEVGGTAREVPIESFISPDRANPSQTLYQMAPLATGPGSALMAGASVPLAWMGMEHNEMVVQARSALRNSAQEMIKAIVINPRFPVAEVERVRKETDIEPRFIDAGPVMRTRMRALDQTLTYRMESAQRDSLDTTLPQSVREDQAANASAIRNYLTLLGAPKGLPDGLPRGSKPTGEHTKDGWPIYEDPDGGKWVDEG